jgi:hypothetical protein
MEMKREMQRREETEIGRKIYIYCSYYLTSLTAFTSWL